jgi:hypothetical protein
VLSFLYACTANVNEPGAPSDPPIPQAKIIFSLTNTDAGKIDTYDFGNVPVTAVREVTLYAINSGEVPLVKLKGMVTVPTPFRYKGGTFPGAGGDCDTTLAYKPTEYCKIVLEYQPTAFGPDSKDFDVTYISPLNAYSKIVLTGTGTTPASLSISDGPTYDFGFRAVGSTTAHTFLITNSGGADATSVVPDSLTTQYEFAGGVFPGTGGNCGATITGGSTCSVVMNFKPIAVGTHNDSIVLNYFDGLNSQVTSRPVTGQAIIPANLVISNGPTYDFGQQVIGSSTDFTFTVTNTGGSNASVMLGYNLSTPFTFKGGPYPGTGGTCAATLTPGGTCTVVVNYSPVASGAATQTMDISYNNGIQSVVSSVDVTGYALAPAKLTITNSPAYNFGTQAIGVTLTQTFTITNSGEVPATVMSPVAVVAPFAWKGGTYPGIAGTCNATLLPAASCDVVVTFAPTVVGPFSSPVAVDYYDGLNNQQVTTTVQGIGALPGDLAISDGPTFDFGGKTLTTVNAHTFTVTNTGGVPSTGLSGAALTLPFRYKGGSFPGTGGDCTATVPAAGTCNIVVEYAPTTSGLHTDTLTLNYSNGVAAQTSSRAIQGTGLMPAVLSISQLDPYDYGTFAIGTSNDFTFTVSNSGGSDATIISGTGLTAPFLFKGGAYPGTGGTCAGPTVAGGSCTIVVSFNPIVVGVFNSTITLNYNDGAASQSTSRNVTGTGANPALLTISNGPTYDFSNHANGSLTNVTLTVTNSGGVPATGITGSGLAAPFDFAAAVGYPGSGGTCTASLGVGATCTIVLSFAPTALGVFTDTVDLTYHNGVAAGQVASRNVSGTGVPPANLTISDGPTYDFGYRALGSTTSFTFTITNTGGVTANSIASTSLASPFTYKGGPFPGTTGTCGASLASGASCTVSVDFTPIALGVFNDSIDISFNDEVAVQTVSRAVTGTGANPALLTFSPSPFDFGIKATDSISTQSFTVTNTGDVDASAIVASGLSVAFSFEGGTYPGTGGTCGTTLATGATCNIVVRYNPTSTGLSVNNLNLTYNNGAVIVTNTVNIQGTGADKALLVISDSPLYDFGTRPVGSSTNKVLTVTNTGGVAAMGLSSASLSAPYSFNGGIFPGTAGNCPVNLSAGATCNIEINYNPTAAGTHPETVVIDYNNGVFLTQSSRDVTAVAVSPALLVISDAPNFNFGLQATGSNTDHIFTITNSGNYAANISGASLTGPTFAFKATGVYPGTGGTCGAILNGGATCDIVVTYSPTAPGVFSDTLTINYNNGLVGTTSSRNINGSAATPASLTISGGPTYNYGTRATGSSTDATFTISNTGGVDATAVAETTLAAPFVYKGGTFPGTGGDCTSVVTAAGSCTIVVSYQPTSTGPHNGTITFGYNDGSAVQSTSIAVDGTGATPALLSLSNAPGYDYGNQPTGSQTDVTITLSNLGGVPANITGATGLASPFIFPTGSFPGSVVAGSCGATLANGSSCTLVVRYAPVALGALTKTLTIAYNDGVTTQNVTRDFTGTGVNPASLAISDGPTFNYNLQAVGSVTDHSFTVTNNGDVTATGITPSGLGAPFDYKGAMPYPGATGDCSITLAAHTSCTMVISYSPTATGVHTSSVSLAYNDGVNPQSVTRNMQGTTANPANLVWTDAPTYDFGLKSSGTTTNYTLTINNTGGVQATALNFTGLAAPFTYTGTGFPGSAGTCTTVLAAASSCTVEIKYSPVTTGLHNLVFNLAYNDGAAPQNSPINIQGTGAAPAVLSVTPAVNPHDFGSVANGSVNTMTFTLNNTGGSPATSITGAGLALPFDYAGGSFPGGGSCGTVLANGATCTFIVTYSPTASGTSNDTIDINYVDGVVAQVTHRDVTGVSASPAVISISDGPTYNYGTLGNGSTTVKIFTLTNIGAFTATGLGGGGLAAPFDFAGATGFPGTGGDCTATLPAGSSCLVAVEFKPTATGVYADSLDIAYNNGVAVQNVSRAISGNGAAPATLAIAPGPANYNFGTRAIGSSNNATFTITNTGGVGATGINGGGLAAPFDFAGGAFVGSGTCGATLPAGSSCTFVVTFAPGSAAVFNDQIDITYNDGVGPQTSSRGVDGTGATPAQLDITPTPLYTFSTIASGATATNSFTITNSGGTLATGITGAGLAAPFSYPSGFPGGGTCTGTLAAGATCTFIVQYAPTSTGAHSGTANVTYNNGVAVVTSSVNVAGNALGPAVLGLDRSPSYNFGTKPLGSSTQVVITVSNTGASPATLMSGGGLAAPFSFPGGYPGQAAGPGVCGTTLAAGASCTFVVDYSPTATGAHSDTVDISYNDGAAVQTVSRDLFGTGANPATLAITPGPATYDYGTKANGSITSATFTITNSGGVTATGMGDGGGLAAPFSFPGGYPGGGTCGATLPAGATCTVKVEFAPTVAGPAASTINVAYNTGVVATNATQNVQGLGALPASIAITPGPAAFNFGNLATGATATQTFTITNSGGFAASTFAAGGLAAPFSIIAGGTCAATLAPATSCTVIVQYAPTTTGAHSDALDITFNDGANNQTVSETVQGSGLSPAILALDNAPTLNFGSKALLSSTDVVVTIQNTGGAPATGMSGGGLAAPFTFSNGGAYPGLPAGPGVCTGTLAAGASCTISVNFTPTSSGTFNDAIDIAFNDGAAAQTSSRPVTGVGIDPAVLAITPGPANYNFGTKATGSNTQATFTLTNTGGYAASVVTGAGLGLPFTYFGGSFPGGGTCTGSLAVGASCTFVVDFSPTATGAQTNTITVNYNNGVAAASATLNVDGTGANPASISVTPVATYNYGTQAQGSTTDVTFTVTNNGGVATSALTATGLAAPFSFPGGFPGTAAAGACSAILNPSASCQVVVRYNPTTSGAHSDSIDFTYNDGAANQSYSHAIQGAGATPGQLTITPGPVTFDYGTVALGAVGTQTFTLQNTGGFPVSSISGGGLSLPYRYAGAGFPGGGSCTSTLAVGATCTFNVEFVPTATGVAAGTISIAFNDGAVAQTATQTLTGTGANPALITISGGATYNYGTAAVGSTNEATFTVQNTGSVDATSLTGGGLALPFKFKGVAGTFPGTGGTCTPTLSAGATCTIVVQWLPTATGAQSDSIDLTYNNGVAAGQTSSRPVQGLGAAPAQLDITGAPGVFDFGTVATGSNTSVVMTVTNNGGVPATGVGGSGLAAPYDFAGGTFPGGGTCTGTLAPSASCTFLVNYSPTLAGATSDTVSVDYNDGVSVVSSTRGVQGTAVAAATLTIAPNPASYDYGTVATGNPVDATFTITNTGSFAASGITPGGLVAPFSYNGGSCVATLAAGANCTLIVRYQPSSTGLQTGAISVAYNDGAIGQTLTQNVQGTGAAPGTLSISDGPGSYDFSSHVVGTTVTKVFTVQNTGGFATSAMSGGGLSGDYSYPGGYPGMPAGAGVCGASLPAGGSCTIRVQYAPTSTGASSSSVDISFNNGTSVQTASRGVTGTGVAPALVSIDQGPLYTYGTKAVGSTNDFAFTVTNNGGFVATGLAFSNLAAPFSLPGGGTCGPTLSAGASCTVVVRYKPTAAVNSTGTLNIDYNDGVAAATTVTRNLDGTGAAPAAFTISNAGYDYGNIVVGNSAVKVFTVTNTGGIAATTVNVTGLNAPFSFPGGYPGHAIAGACGATIAAGASCTINVQYAPTATGAHNNTFTFNFYDGVGANTQTHSIQGTGVTPALLTVSDAPGYDFGPTAISTTSTATLTINNSGSVAATGLSGTGLVPPFAFGNGGTYPGQPAGAGVCGATLAAGASCTIVVTYSPTAAAVHTGTVTINYNDGVAAQTATRDLQGTGLNPAVLAISNGPTYDFTNRALNSSTDFTFTVTNTGGTNATAIVPTGLSAPFSWVGGFPGTGGTCSGAGLAAGASCTFTVTYNPTATGSLTRTINLAFNNGIAAANSTIDVTGTGVNPGLLDITPGPAAYNFGSKATGSVTDVTFTVTNNGNFAASGVTSTSLTASFSYTSGAFPGHAGVGACTGTIAPSASCTIMVRYAPTATGAHTNTITINYSNGATTTTSNLTINGTGVTPANITLSGSPSVDFGNTQTGVTKTALITLTNTGGIGATGIAVSGISGVFALTGGSFPGTGGNCPVAGTLAAGANCDIEIEFTPATNIAYLQTLSVGYNDGAAAASVTRDVKGLGVNPAILTFTDASPFDFGTNATGSNTQKSFTVTNTGGYAATITGGAALTLPYSYYSGAFPGFGGDCTGSIAPAATCTVVVNYNPTTAAVHNDTLQINYNNGLAAVNSTIALTGTGANPATLTIVPGPAFGYGSQATGSINDQLFTITNTGSTTATSLSITSLAAPFTFSSGSFPGHAVAGFCTTTLAPAASCTVSVRYNPTTTGAHSGNLTVVYHNGVVAGQSVTTTLSGTGMTPANLSMDLAPSWNFGNVAVGGTSAKIVTITNNGSVNATLMSGGGLAAPFKFTSGSYPGHAIAGACAGTLAPTSSCTISVSFDPTALGAASDTIDISYNNGATTATANRDLIGTGVSTALLTISDGPGNYNFGPITNGGSTTHVFTLTNSGGVDATGVTGSGIAAPYTFNNGGNTFPGTGGDCTGTLTSGSSCVFVVKYAPTAVQADTGTVTVTYNNGVTAGQTTTRGVQGSGVAPAGFTFADAPSYNYGSKTVGSNTDYTISVTNTGGSTATVMAGTFVTGTMYTFTNGSYPGHTGAGACGATLAPTQSCTMMVKYSPTTAAVHNDTLTLAFNGGAGALSNTLGLTGTGVTAGTLAIAPATTANYGSRPQGSTLDLTFTVTNTGGSTVTAIADGLTLAAPYTFPGGFPGGTGAGFCGANLAPAATCNIVVRYAPTTTGAHPATITVSYNTGAGAATATQAITGTGVAPANLAIDQNPLYDFSNVAVNANKDFVFTLTNNGGYAANSIAGGGLGAPFSYPGGFPGMAPGAGVCTTTLAVGASCTFTARFTPTVSGLQTDAIDISYDNGAATANVTRNVQGTGLDPAIIAITPAATFDYGTKAVGSNNDQTFTITNSGGTAATVMTAPALAGSFAFKTTNTFPGAGGTCTGTLNAGSSCTMIVTYTPAGVGVHSQTIALAYNDGVAAQTSNHAIQGTGAAAALLSFAVGPANYNYGSVVQNSTNDVLFTINNTGSVAAAISGGTGLAAPFSFSSGSYPGHAAAGACGATLPAGGSCTVSIRYNPTTSGAHSGSVAINYNNGASNTSVTQGFDGSAVAPALLTITDSPSYDYGNTTVTATKTRVFTITNTGGYTASLMSGGGLVAPFAFSNGGTYPGDLAGTKCGVTLASLATCTISVDYNPTAAGHHTDAIDIAYNDGGTGQTLSLPLTGDGIVPATLTFAAGATYDFLTKATTSSTTVMLTVNNTGGYAANISGGAGLAAPFDFPGGFPGGGTCSGSIAAGGSCTIGVRFQPTANVLSTNTLTLSYNNGIAATTSSIDVKGTGAPAAQLDISNVGYNYGTKATGSVTDFTFTITNNGGVQATAMADGLGLAAPFTWASGSYPGTAAVGACAATLDPGNSCQVVVRYSPTTTGAHSSNLKVSYHKCDRWDGCGSGFIIS